jgi:DNA-binding response OmpR family regulator
MISELRGDSAPEAEPLTVLVAEDEPDSRKALAHLLSNWGYRVVAVPDGAAAWEVLRGDSPPRVAILDWMMPGVDGLEVCRRARELPSEPPHLIMLTARGSREDLVAGLEGGADEYLAKPVDVTELRARIHAAWRLVELQARLADRVRQLESAPPAQEVVGENHPGLRQTLRLCAATFAEALAVPDFSRPLRIAMRTCRALCQEALGGEEAAGTSDPLPQPAGGDPPLARSQESEKNPAPDS